jgi:molybdopterin/thiamine biosynthesis adenylyltransferase/rhodanese-related sulfurtransferase
MSNLTKEELKRYQRQVILKGFGLSGQERLKAGKILVIGAGGLGAPCLLYLAAAGVGTIGIVEHDIVDISNLQRQIIYATNEEGEQKAKASRQKLLSLNPLLSCHVHELRIDGTNALPIISQYDVVIDCSDNFPTRYLVNDACVILGKALVYGSILEFEGQVSVFNQLLKDDLRSANYRDLFPEPPAPDAVPNCAEAGVIGALAGIIGCMQAVEAVKILTGIGHTLAGKLLIFDALDMSQTIINIPDRGARKTIKTLVDYEDFCGISRDKNKSLKANQEVLMKEVTAQELKQMKDSGADFQLIDVREPYEYDICNLDGELIPMSEIPANVDKISKDKKVVIHCRSGKRSGDMLLWLEKNHGFDNLYNLKGGILAWAKDVDPEMPTY